MIGVPATDATVVVSVARPVPKAFVAVSGTTEAPPALGVPVMTPVKAFRARPGGSPLAVKFVGEPATVIVKLNGVPIVPAAVSGLLLMTGATPAATTVIVSVALPVPFAFVAPSNTDVVPTVVGVPVIAPVAALTTTPAGSGPAV